MLNRLQDLGGKGCSKNKLIITSNGDMDEDFPGQQKRYPEYFILARGQL
jgi:hypothetical protein